MFGYFGSATNGGWRTACVCSCGGRVVVAEEVAEGFFFTLGGGLRSPESVFVLAVALDGVGVFDSTLFASWTWWVIVACCSLGGVSVGWSARGCGTVGAIEEARSRIG